MESGPSDSGQLLEAAPLERKARPMVSVVIPVYFNEGSIPALGQKLVWLETTLTAKGVALEVIFVDDGSEDNSLQELLLVRGRLTQSKVVKLARNFGAVSAHRAGLKFVNGDCYVVIAADLQDPIETIVDMVDAWRSGDRFVICQRAKRRDPLTTRLYAALYYRILKAIVTDKYPRGGYDLALVDRQLFRELAKAGKNVNPNLFLVSLGFKPRIFAYERSERKHGRSRWTFRKRVKFFVDSILGFSMVPVRIVTLFGLAAAVLSFLYGLNVLIAGILGLIEVRGFPTLAFLVSFFAGLMLFTLGMIAEYIWRIYDELSGRPDAIVDVVY